MMEILLWASEAPETAAVAARLERGLADRFGDVRRDPGDSMPDVVVVALRGADLELGGSTLDAAVRRAERRTVPLVVVPLEGTKGPAVDRLAPSLRPLADAPVVAPDDLVEVLQFIDDADRTIARALVRPARVSRPPTGSPGRPTLVRRIRRNIDRRDAVLLKISASSTAAGVLLFSLLGFGPASLFFFVGGVTFLLSSPPD